ncbi:unnamed protein product [Periconia digitata]|uniref:Frequency clock protein n=1 Tax=Periconia digitata TaxID=1303443 RepID=A0A9W4UHZ6_9PLEO|nr:unnamed protein product [Periconia digitata]
MSDPDPMPPGTIPPLESKISRHPRRPLAHKSVSLRHNSPTHRKPAHAPSFHQPQQTSVSPSSLNASASDRVNPPSSLSPKLQSNKYSSGESSDAGKWFESSNNNAIQSNASYADNDTPFFLRNSSSGDTPPEGQASHADQLNTLKVHRPDIAHGGTDGSSTEEYRGVIDDLTVANKKLKRKLKRFEKLYDTHLQNEKLFEVRFHGLSDYKKKELEETLRKFADSLNDGPADNLLNPPFSSYPPILDPHKTSSSNPSRFAESGYASMSASGQNSSGPSYPAHSGDTDHRRMTKSQYNRQQQSIQSYLHDIPAGLLPTNEVPMSEKSKKKLVVRRLEQIFAGKRSAPGNHSQPMQQEEVAQSAASADRQAKEATGQHTKHEGHREARIMPVKADDEDIVTTSHIQNLQRLRPNLQVNEQDFAGSASPDQRPTRPLDLDLFRAQVPSDNMEYIRHLGFTPPDMDTGEAPQMGHGWIYLNLLINMAQLHTISVTSDFVKTAVTEYSSKLELSHDGRKIRWKGGLDETKTSSGSSSEHMSGYSPSEANGTSTGVNSNTRTGNSGSTGINLDADRNARRLARAHRQKEREKLSYTPIFFHKEESDEDEDFYGYDMMSSTISNVQRQQPGDSSGLGSSAMRSSSSRKRRDDGPMIFYNKANFCTDLSGDLRGLAGRQLDSIDLSKSHALGVSRSPKRSAQYYAMERRRPHKTPSPDLDVRDGTNTSSSDGDIQFSPDPMIIDSGLESPNIVDFEASGVGGVHPADNFSVKVRRAIHSSSVKAPVALPKRKFYPQEVLQALAGSDDADSRVMRMTNQPPHVREEILSAARKPLPSSSLPPASFLPFDSTSSGEVDSDLDDEISSNPSTTSSSVNGPIGAPIPTLSLSPIYPGDQDDSSEDESSEDESSDDGSIDLLATARQMDPSTIRASEREYDAALAERLAECIPAGSSAATGGGGSGFNSPYQAIPASTTRNSTTSGSMSSRTQNLKRTRTRDMANTALQEGNNRKSQRTE